MHDHDTKLWKKKWKQICHKNRKPRRVWEWEKKKQQLATRMVMWQPKERKNRQVFADVLNGCNSFSCGNAFQFANSFPDKRNGGWCWIFWCDLTTYIITVTRQLVTHTHKHIRARPHQQWVRSHHLRDLSSYASALLSVFWFNYKFSHAVTEGACAIQQS